MEPALVSLMLAEASIAALVARRINWVDFPQGVGPTAIRLNRIGGAMGHTMRGVDGLDSAQVQIDIRAETGFLAALVIARAVKALLDGYRGVHGGTDFRGIFLGHERHYAEKADPKLYHVISLDFDIWSRSAT